MKLHVSLGDHERQDYEDALSFALQNSEHKITADPTEAEFLVFSPDSPIRDFTQLPHLKFVQSIWAGVDSIVKNETLNVPLARLVDAGLSEGMREYVLGHILADHIRIDNHQNATTWDDQWLPLARSKTIGIVGIGTLGQSVADAALAIGFNVLGWSSTPKNLPYSCSFGKDALYEMLSQSDYVVTLLPHTLDTKNIINHDFLKSMKNDAMLINPGRGALLDEDALIEALNNNELRRAVLDVFKIEPLPQDHPFWAHDRILVTPHIAAKSRLETALDVILENLDRVEKNEPPLYLVDRNAGY